MPRDHKIVDGKNISGSIDTKLIQAKFYLENKSLLVNIKS